MVMINKNLVAICVICALAVALVGGACIAQQTATASIWQSAPPTSLLVAAYDGRADNPGTAALLAAEDPAARDLRTQRSAAMHKAIEDFATLFGVSLDFAKDIQSWAGEQWALVLLPDGERVQPVFVAASKDAVAAGAALQKLLAPWQRIGELTPQEDSDYPITAFKMKSKGIEVYSSASGPVVALSPSKASLKLALKGGGFAVGSAGDKVSKALAGSAFSAFVDPALMKLFHMKSDQIPLAGFGLGASTVATGVKVRVLGVLNEGGAAFAKQILPTAQAGGLAVNPGIPSASLVAASLPDLSGPMAIFGMAGMAKKNPMLGAAQALSDVQVSAAMTAVLPMPAGVASAMAASDQAATDKLAQITEALKAMKLPTASATVSGIQTTTIGIAGGPTLYLAQVGKHILLASDALSLAGAAAAAKGEQPSIAQSDTYKETMAGLGDSNLLTLYANLAPVQGIGFLLEGLGVAQWTPLHAGIVKSIENLQGLGVGVGFDGEIASATMFLRAKPGLGTGIGPAVAAGAAIGAAMAFPVFARARESAQSATCQSNLRQLALAAMMYAADWNGKLPTSTKWQSQLKGYTKVPVSDMKCPTGDTIYAFNKNLSGLSEDQITNPADTIMFFEAKRGLPNASGSRADAILPHRGRGGFAYVDTHVRLQSEVPAQSQWVPKPAKKSPSKSMPAQGKRRQK